MRAVVQRVSHASVAVEGESVAAIGSGFLVLVAVGHGDDEATASRMAAKVVALRVFEDAEGRMNLALRDVDGAVLAVSQFTLYGDTRRGNRPSFTGAAPPERARELYESFCSGIEALGIGCGRGRFGEHMQVELLNDGPVTILLDSADFERARRA